MDSAKAFSCVKTVNGAAQSRETLQAQTKIIKIKAKNQHNKILNSNNSRAKKMGEDYPDIALLVRSFADSLPASFPSTQ